MLLELLVFFLAISIILGAVFLGKYLGLNTY